MLMIFPYYCFDMQNSLFIGQGNLKIFKKTMMMPFVIGMLIIIRVCNLFNHFQSSLIIFNALQLLGAKGKSIWLIKKSACELGDRYCMGILKYIRVYTQDVVLFQSKTFSQIVPIGCQAENKLRQQQYTNVQQL